MIDLQNRELRIEVVDPIVDASRLGVRYCWGGYIWQVHDAVAGPLLVGPEWPNAMPLPFNGQGLPESFRHRTLEGAPLTWRDHTGVALGAGQLRVSEDGAVRVVVPCAWEIARHDERLVFATPHAVAGIDYAMTRTIELAGREVRSITHLTNKSNTNRLTLQWFAHPFFPLVAGEVQASVPAGCTLAGNPGFVLDGTRLKQKRRFLHQNDGHMERSFRLPRGRPLEVTLAHPAVTSIDFTTSFAPEFCVIWGNDRTFSFEPYLALDLAPGESREWSLYYRFGESSGISVSKET